MPKKVYLVLADGNSVHTLKWVKELNIYFDVYIISFNSYNKEVISLLGMNRCFYFHTNIKTSGGNFSILCYVFNLVRLIRCIKPQYINAHYITSYGTMAVLAACICNYRGKIILSAWGTDILITPWKNKVYFYLTKWILQRSDIITSDSFYMTEKINAIHHKANVLTFPFGLDFYPTVICSEKNKGQFFSNRGLEPNYNITLVIKIFDKLYKCGLAKELYIANDGTEKIELQKLVKQLGLSKNIHFLGFLSMSEQKEFYKKCGYYISVPCSDSTSVSLLEAMSYGCVPIVSNIPANLEWVKNLENGIVVNGLAEVDIRDLDFEKAFDMNRKKIAEEAIWSKNIGKYINFLEHVKFSL